MAAAGTISSVVDEIAYIWASVPGIKTVWGTEAKQSPQALYDAQIPAVVIEVVEARGKRPLVADTLQTARGFTATVYWRQRGSGQSNQPIDLALWSLVDNVDAVFFARPRLLDENGQSLSGVTDITPPVDNGFNNDLVYADKPYAGVVFTFDVLILRTF